MHITLNGDTYNRYSLEGVCGRASPHQFVCQFLAMPPRSWFFRRTRTEPPAHQPATSDNTNTCRPCDYVPRVKQRADGLHSKPSRPGPSRERTGRTRTGTIRAGDAVAGIVQERGGGWQRTGGRPTRGGCGPASAPRGRRDRHYGACRNPRPAGVSATAFRRFLSRGVTVTVVERRKEPV